jgi:hypothetical protein
MFAMMLELALVPLEIAQLLCQRQMELPAMIKMLAPKSISAILESVLELIQLFALLKANAMILESACQPLENALNLI